MTITKGLGPLGPGPYATKALENETENVRRAGAGNRNVVLYSAARCLGQLVAGGELDELATVDQLTQSALDTGLDPVETRSTIRSGMRAGKRRPRNAPNGRALESLPESFRLPYQLQLALTLRSQFPFEWEVAKALSFLPPELARQDVESNREYLERHAVDLELALVTAYAIRGVAVFRYLDGSSIQDPNAIRAAVWTLLKDVEGDD